MPARDGGTEIDMKREKLSERKLPDYTKGEEIFNMTTHIVGGGVGLVALCLCVIFAAIHKNVYAVIGSAIYGASMIVLYTMSSIYHGLKPDLKAKKVFQVIDHCSIFLLIAGTYTPICLAALRLYSPAVGWTVFGVVWGAAAIGITLNSIDLKSFEKISVLCYLAMGWCIIFAWRATTASIARGGIVFLVTGGIAYSIGALFYILQRKKRFMHSVFHIFVVLGSLLHMFCILFYIV